MSRTYEIVVWATGSIVTRRWCENEKEALLHWSEILESDLLDGATRSALQVDGKDREVCYWSQKASAWIFMVPIASDRELRLIMDDLTVHSTIERIKEWDQKAWDFLRDSERALAECEGAGVPWWPTRKQVLYLARLHKAFVEFDGMGTHILVEAGEYYVTSR